MSFFNRFFAKNNEKTGIRRNERDFEGDTIGRCSRCGQFFPLKYAFCPYCGKRMRNINYLDRDADVLNTEQCFKTEAYEIPEERLHYLQECGLLEYAHKVYTITVVLEGEGNAITLRMQGWKNSDDAIQILNENGIVSRSARWRFSDWPNANPTIGPWYRHCSACVCELNSFVLHLERYDITLREEDIRTLYGCPNSATIDYAGLEDRMMLKVVQYGK